MRIFICYRENDCLILCAEQPFFLFDYKTVINTQNSPQSIAFRRVAYFSYVIVNTLEKTLNILLHNHNIMICKVHTPSDPYYCIFYIIRATGQKSCKWQKGQHVDLYTLAKKRWNKMSKATGEKNQRLEQK